MAEQPSRVLARKYRPRHFGELIGQAPMVRTLTNAFAHERIPQAWMLTGVRGVGKTTTARILARALNYERDGEGRGPTISIEEPGIHCQAIMEGRHVDVIEMDAASHTGIADIREITEAARYKPVSALYKVYIIDEVHMLSTAAFNGLLKTLEEPPAHVKFIFATTEIRKVPVTILSRCQRFDLRRVDTDVLATHLTDIARKESVEADAEALTVIARVAEGSVRDSLSLLDQAIAYGGGQVTGEALREMLGLADRGRVVDLFEAVMRGDPAAALAELAEQYAVGADPYVVLSDLAGFVHEVTRRKVTGCDADPAEVQDVRERAARAAESIGMAALSRVWQALTAGLAEIQSAGKPMVAAEMVLIRIAYMASLPEPGPLPLTEAPDAPRTKSQRIKPASADAAPVSQAQRSVRSLADIAALLGSRYVRLKVSVERHMRAVKVEPGRLEVTLTPQASPSLAGELGEALRTVTGQRWIVTVTDGGTAPTLHEAAQRAEAVAKEAAKDEPLVKALLSQFGDAQVVAVRTNETEAEPKARHKG